MTGVLGRLAKLSAQDASSDQCALASTVAISMSRHISAELELLLSDYQAAREHGQFGKDTEIWQAGVRLQQLLETREAVRERPTLRVKWSVGQGNWAKVPWIAFLDTRETNTTQQGVYCVYLFRQDMSGVYLTLNQGVTKPKEELGSAGGRNYVRDRAAKLRTFSGDLKRAGFILDNAIDLHAEPGLGKDYEYSTAAYKLYEANAIPDDEVLLQDLEALLTTYDLYLEHEQLGTIESRPAQPSELTFVLSTAVEALIAEVENRGFVYEPWQIAAFVAAVRTKPFVILAGITGTGKSKLPAIVADATGARSRIIPVRPDWTDSADVLGYSDLQGMFRPGAILLLAREAAENSGLEWFCVVDEMNLARVEQYFAEVLSRIEDRYPSAQGGFASRPLLAQPLTDEDGDWATVGLSPNLAIVGTVNMDENSQGFSRKVLDRAFTLELSDVDLTIWKPIRTERDVLSGCATWPVSAWHPRAITLSTLQYLSSEDEGRIDEVIGALTEINQFLAEAQLQVGYRTRDEAALFVLHASETGPSFVDRTGRSVDPLDLVLNMKVLPRIVGGSGAVRQTVLKLLGWSFSGNPLSTEDEAAPLVSEWERENRPSALQGAKYPRTAARLCLMWERLLSEGFTSYWL